MKEYVNRKELGEGRAYRVEINEPREFYELKDGEWIEED